MVLTPQFAPNAKEIAYLAYVNKTAHVYVINVHTRKKRLVGHFKGMTFAPRFSPDGKYLLMSLAREGKEDSEVSLAKGTFAFRQALLELLAQKKPINVYGASNASVDIYGLGFLKEFHAKRIKEKIMMRHIYNEDAPDRINQLNKMKCTAARYLPKEYDTMVSTVVCGPYVLLSMFSSPPYLIILKNDQIADTYNRYFELLWKQASDKKQKKVSA